MRTRLHLNEERGPRANHVPLARLRSDDRLVALGELAGSGLSRAERAIRHATSVPRFAIERVRPGASLALLARPRGPVLKLIGATTPFGSPQTLAVAERRGGYLGVTSSALPNGAVAWISARSRTVSQSMTSIWLRADVDRRRLELLDGRRVLRTVTVGVGEPGAPTPTGRFAVTDKLSGAPYGGAYGCCVVALSAHQPHTPLGWTGGNRVAIHGTDEPSGIGQPVSGGCLEAGDDDMRMLMRRVPLGAPVFIER